MKIRHVLILAVLTLILGIPAFVHAQQPTQVSTVLIGRAFNDVVSNDAAPAAADADQDTPPAPADQGTLASSVDQTSAPAAKAEVHAPPPHTGFKALASDTWADFKSFPRRCSTWIPSK